MNKNDRIQIRVTPAEKKEFKKRAKEKGFRNMSDFIFCLLKNSSKLIISVSLFFLVGCAMTMMDGLDSTRMKAPHRLVVETFNAPYDRVFETTQLACAESGLRIIQSSKDQGKIYADRIPTGWESHSGETIGIYLTTVNKTQTKAELAIQKNDVFDTGYQDSRAIILNLIRAKLGSMSPSPHL